MSDQLTLIVFLRAKAGAEDELSRRLGALVEPTHREPGCLLRQDMELHYMRAV